MRLFKRRAKAWRLIARVTTEEGGYEQVYDGADGISSPEFAAGFLCGSAWARGIEPEMITIQREKI